MRAGFQVRSNLPKNRHRVPLFLNGSCGRQARMDEKHVCPTSMHVLPFKAVMLPGNWDKLTPGAMRGVLPEVSADRKKSAVSTVRNTCRYRCRPVLELEKNHRKPCL